MARATRSEWSKRVEAWARSGLTAREFATRTGLSARSLIWWKWRLGREARTAPPVVEVALALAEPKRQPFEVVLDDRLRLLVPPGFDAESLQRLLAVLAPR